MSFIGYVCRKLMPYAILLMFIAFGISILLVSDNATYLTSTKVGDITQYTFDFRQYLIDLSTNRFATLSKYFDFTKAQQIFESANTENAKWWQVLLASLQWFVNLLITILNIVLIMPVQFIVIVLQYILSLVGVNMNADWWLANGVNWIQQNLTIPLWGSVANVIE